MVTLGKPRGARARINSMVGVDPEIAALFARKPRTPKAAPEPKIRKTRGSGKFRPDRSTPAARAALVVVGHSDECAESSGSSALASCPRCNEIVARARGAAARDGGSAVVEPIGDGARLAELEQEVARLRACAARWKACARMLRERATSLQHINDRIRNRVTEPGVALVGSVEHMRTRTADLPVPANPWGSNITFADDAPGGDE